MTAQRIGTGLARGAAGDIGFAWALGLGVGLLAFGLLGFVPNPLVGAPSVTWGTPLFVTGDAHDVLNLVAGAVVLYGALGLTGRRRGVLLIVVGRHRSRAVPGGPDQRHRVSACCHTP